jgi:hypothetical protein
VQSKRPCAGRPFFCRRGPEKISLSHKYCVSLIIVLFWDKRSGRGGVLPVYTILPVDPAEARIEIDTQDTADVLKVVGALACGEADVLVDGKYTFSVRTFDNNLLAFFQRDPDRGVIFGEFG